MSCCPACAPGRCAWSPTSAPRPPASGPASTTSPPSRQVLALVHCPGPRPVSRARSARYWAGAVSTRSATGSGVRLGRAGRGRQVLLEDLARRAVAEAAPRGVVEPVGEPAEAGAGERLGRALARQEAAGGAR